RSPYERDVFQAISVEVSHEALGAWRGRPLREVADGLVGDVEGPRAGGEGDRQRGPAGTAEQRDVRTAVTIEVTRDLGGSLVGPTWKIRDGSRETTHSGHSDCKPASKEPPSLRCPV